MWPCLVLLMFCNLYQGQVARQAFVPKSSSLRNNVQSVSQSSSSFFFSLFCPQPRLPCFVQWPLSLYLLSCLLPSLPDECSQPESSPDFCDGWEWVVFKSFVLLFWPIAQKKCDLLAVSRTARLHCVPSAENNGQILPGCAKENKKCRRWLKMSECEEARNQTKSRTTPPKKKKSNEICRKQITNDIRNRFIEARLSRRMLQLFLFLYVTCVWFTLVSRDKWKPVTENKHRGAWSHNRCYDDDDDDDDDDNINNNKLNIIIIIIIILIIVIL